MKPGVTPQYLGPSGSGTQVPGTPGGAAPMAPPEQNPMQSAIARMIGLSRGGAGLGQAQVPNAMPGMPAPMAPPPQQQGGGMGGIASLLQGLGGQGGPPGGASPMATPQPLNLGLNMPFNPGRPVF